MGLGAGYIDTDDGGTMELGMGGSVIVPAAVRGYFMVGQATLFKASVPLNSRNYG